MNTPDKVDLYLRCIEHDLRRYLMDPSDFTSEYFEDIHCLLLDVMHRLGVTPESEEGEEKDDDA
jgi:hypothetical protein